MDGMTIGQLAAHSGVSISAIRFYQRRGLLPARQTNGGWQRFGPDTMARLTVIELAKGCGFTLDEIAVLLDALYAPTSPTATWQAMGEAKLAELDAQAARLQQMRRLLTEALSYCHLDLDRSQIIATALGWADRPQDQPSLPADTKGPLPAHGTRPRPYLPRVPPKLAPRLLAGRAADLRRDRSGPPAADLLDDLHLPRVRLAYRRAPDRQDAASG